MTVSLVVAYRLDGDESSSGRPITLPSLRKRLENKTEAKREYARSNAMYPRTEGLPRLGGHRIKLRWLDGGMAIERHF